MDKIIQLIPVEGYCAVIGIPGDKVIFDVVAIGLTESGELSPIVEFGEFVRMDMINKAYFLKRKGE